MHVFVCVRLTAKRDTLRRKKNDFTASEGQLNLDEMEHMGLFFVGVSEVEDKDVCLPLRDPVVTRRDFGALSAAGALPPSVTGERFNSARCFPH